MFLTPMLALHTLLSLAAIGLGVFAIAGFFQSRHQLRCEDGFIATAVLTSLTGFLLPLHGLSPAVVVGVIALIVLAIVMQARFLTRRSRRWRTIYIGGVIFSLYLLVFVGIAQAFDKLPWLHGLSPTQHELPFVIAQVLTMVVFVSIGLAATRAQNRRLAA